LRKGIPSIVKFFGVQTLLDLVATGQQADLLVGNNVLAHVPDVNDFVAGMKILLKPNGIFYNGTCCSIQQNQFDTIYHEHFPIFLSYSHEDFAAHGLTLLM